MAEAAAGVTVTLVVDSNEIDTKKAHRAPGGRI